MSPACKLPKIWKNLSREKTDWKKGTSVAVVWRADLLLPLLHYSHYLSIFWNIELTIFDLQGIGWTVISSPSLSSLERKSLFRITCSHFSSCSLESFVLFSTIDSLSLFFYMNTVYNKQWSIIQMTQLTLTIRSCHRLVALTCSPFPLLSHLSASFFVL